MGKIIRFKLAAIALILLIPSCSTPPKNPGDVFTLRNHAEAGLDQGNREAGRGNYESAYRTIAESKRNALLTDDSSLIIRCCLSLGNVLINLGREDEAFSEYDQAIAEARRINSGELLAVSTVFRARGMLVTGRASAQSVLDEIEAQQANIRLDRRNIAFAWQAKSQALRALNRYDEAEDALKKSLEIHEKDMNLEDASFDWYSIASIRSVSGNTQGAIDALRSSIAIDRRIENSYGLASSYRAMGDVYLRMGDNQLARESYTRALRIFEAMGNSFEIAETIKKMEN